MDNAINRLTSISETVGQTTTTLESYSYLGLDTVVKRAHPQPGVDLTYINQTGEANGDGGDQYTGLDRFDRVVDQRWIVTANGTHTDRFQYGYDRDSNRLYRNNLVNTAFGELYHASGAGFGYDNLNQLSGFLRGVLTASGGSGTPLDTVTSPSRTQSWSPDALGNFASVTTNGTAVTRTHNKQNEVTGVGTATLVFDNNGNMTTDEQGRTLVYDGWNRLVAVKSGSTTLASYKFDARGRRIVETAGSNTRDLYFDGWNVLEERLNGASSVDVQYVWSPVYVNALILRDRSTQHNGTLDERLYVQQDANWNVTALITTSGTVVERYAYDPYGLVAYLNASWSTLSGSAYSFVYLFQGERIDAATGLFHMDLRDYSATLQRWVQVDPIRFLAGDINLYRAVGNNPTGLVDPAGLMTSLNSREGAMALAFLAAAMSGIYGTYGGQLSHIDPELMAIAYRSLIRSTKEGAAAIRSASQSMMQRQSQASDRARCDGPRETPYRDTERPGYNNGKIHNYHEDAKVFGNEGPANRDLPAETNLRRGGFDGGLKQEEKELARKWEESGLSRQEAEKKAREAVQSEIDANKNSPPPRSTDPKKMDQLPSNPEEQGR